MMYILNIETATKNCSVSLAKDGVTIGLKEIAEQNFSHAEKLHIFIADLLSEHQITFNDLKAIAVSQRPRFLYGFANRCFVCQRFVLCVKYSNDCN